VMREEKPLSCDRGGIAFLLTYRYNGNKLIILVSYMKKCFAYFILILAVLFISGCSNEIVFSSESGSITLSYNGNEYDCVSGEECEYKYSSKDMVYLSSLNNGEFLDSSESYDVYRHVDDKVITYLFVIPKPSLFRDMTAYSFIMKIKKQAE
jgi:hypothetical protein